MREGIVPTKTKIVLADSEIVTVEFESALLKSGSVSECQRFNYELIDIT
jgi:hypothetical protein